MPRGGALAGLAQDPFAERHDQLALLGGADELARGQESAVGVGPAHERLGGHDLAGAQVIARLEVHAELAGDQRGVQLGLEIDPARPAPARRRSLTGIVQRGPREPYIGLASRRDVLDLQDRV